MASCHCKDCRRAHGSAFATTTLIRAEDFIVTTGDSFIINHKARYFCRRCGTPLYNREDRRSAAMGLVVASLDVDPPDAPSIHVNVASKVRWFEISDGDARYEGFPPQDEILKAYLRVSDSGSSPDMKP